MHLARAPVDLVGPYDAHKYLNSNIQAFTRLPLLSVATVRPLSCECLTFNAHPLPLLCYSHDRRYYSLSVAFGLYEYNCTSTHCSTHCSKLGFLRIIASSASPSYGSAPWCCHLVQALPLLTGYAAFSTCTVPIWPSCKESARSSCCSMSWGGALVCSAQGIAIPAPCVTLWYRQLTIVLRPHESHSRIPSNIDCSHLLSVLRFGTSWHRSRITFVSSIAARHGIALCRVLDTFSLDSSTVSSVL